jgi:D-amino-acid dehydrogenase
VSHSAGRATIVGSGIVGICAALSLLEKGFTVEIIDRDKPAEGASHGNAGVISPWTCVPQSLPGLWASIPKWLLDAEGPASIRWGYLLPLLPWALRFLRAGKAHRLQAISDAMHVLNRPNVDLYRHHLKGTGAEHLLSPSTYVHVYRNPAEADLDSLVWRMRQDRGVPLQLLDAGELHEIEPALADDCRAAVLIKDQARATDPGALGKALAEKALSMGATFRQTSVATISSRPGDRWTLHTDIGELNAEKLVIAAGAWSARLLAPLGIRLPLEAERGYHLVFRDCNVTLNNSVMDTDRKFVVSSMLAGLRCAGTAEFAGLDAAPDYRRATVFERLVKRLIPKIEINETVEWMGSRPSFPDSLPVIGQVPGPANLFAAFGHSHYGLGMAPHTGRIVAALLAGEPAAVDLGPYRIDRFH